MPEIPIILTPGKILAPGSARLRLLEDHLSRPIVITGGSGGGKTKLLELVCRQLISQGIGFTYIDPHGDGTDAVLRYLCTSNVDPGRINLIQPTPGSAVRIDPFAYVPPGLSDKAYGDWLHTTSDRVVGAFLRGFTAADQEIMARLQSWLRTILFCCGVKVDGRHLGIDHAPSFLLPKQPAFEAVWGKVARRVQQIAPRVFAQVDDFSRSADSIVLKLIESTRNCLDRVFRTHTAQSMFGTHAPEAMNLRQVILGRQIQLVNVRETRFISRQQGNIIGGMIASLLMAESRALAEDLPFENRVPHFLIIDEAENFVGEDIRMGFAELRKFRMPLCLAFQDINCLLRGDLDLVSKAFGNAGLLISFCQQDVESIEYLGKAFAYTAILTSRPCWCTKCFQTVMRRKQREA